MSEPVRQMTIFDSARERLGVEYARALLGAVAAPDQAATVVAELEAFVLEVLDRAPGVAALLESLRVPVAVQLAALDKTLAGRVSAPLLTFLKVVCRRRRFDCLRAIARAARSQLRAQQGRVEVLLRSATPLDDALCARISQRLEALLGQRVDLVKEQDPAVIGGVVMRVGDTVYDASVARSLERLRQTAADAVAQAARESLNLFATAMESKA